MKEYHPFNKTKIKLVFFLLAAILFVCCKRNCNYYGTLNQVPRMLVYSNAGKQRFNSFKDGYKKAWNFNNPEDISIHYSIKDFENITQFFFNQFFKLTYSTDSTKDSIRVYMAACDTGQYKNIPGTIILGRRPKKIILIFSPVQIAEIKRSFVICTDTISGYREMFGTVADMLEENFFYNSALNVTSPLDPYDSCNYENRTLKSPDFSNTRYINYSYLNWEEYFITEVNFQLGIDSSKRCIDSVDASFVAHTKDGDGQHQEVAYKNIERANRLHILYQFSIHGKPFFVDKMPEFDCRPKPTLLGFAGGTPSGGGGDNGQANP